MTAEVESVQVVAPASPAKSPVKAKKATKTKAAGVKGARKPITHPPTADMVNAAIAALKERGGSSVIAIKKYVVSTYKVDGEKITPFIKKYLKSAVTSGKVVQTKGTGASGSFKLPASAKSSKPKAAAAKPKKVKNTASSAADKKPKVKKATSTGTKKVSSTTKKSTKVVKTKLATVKKTPVKKDKAAPKKSLLKKVKKVAKSPKPKKVLKK